MVLSKRNGKSWGMKKVIHYYPPTKVGEPKVAHCGHEHKNGEPPRGDGPFPSDCVPCDKCLEKKMERKHRKDRQ